MTGRHPLVRTTPIGRIGIGRRRFVQGVAAAGTLAGLGGLRPGEARAAPAPMPLLAGSRFDLTIEPTPINITGRRRIATAVNGSVPAPILYWRQGDTVTLNVTNRLDVPTSIHWHGVRSPANMDGVPGLSFSGIARGETFVYRIPVHQSGTYWYHSHSGFQEQTGLYGPLIIEPRAGYPVAFDRDYVVFLSDWTDLDPEEVVSNLKYDSSYFNFEQRTVGTFFGDVRRHGLASTVADRLTWGKMRMSPTDILDVSGHTYTFLLNGMPPAANWTGLFRPGERVRLRFINGSTMSYFDVRIPGLTMSVVEADGNSVVPVEVDEFRIATAETYDVIVQPRDDRAYTIFAQSEDRTGYARGTLATRAGTAGPIPPMDPRPIRTMAAMGMGAVDKNDQSRMTVGANSAVRRAPDVMSMGNGGMGGMDMGDSSEAGMHTRQAEICASSASHAATAVGHSPTPRFVSTGGGISRSDGGTSEMPDMSQGNSKGGMGGMEMEADPIAARLKGSPEVDNVAMAPTDQLNDPGAGLAGNGRRVLTYADLCAVQRGDDPRPPTREILLHLTGNMERFIWGFNGKKFSEAPPIPIKLGERVRFTLINDTMMEHPIHLHGLWSELENGHGEYRPYKHTINVKPGEKLSYLVSADEPGHWAYHCHLLYHMEMGMFRTVIVA